MRKNKRRTQNQLITRARGRSYSHTYPRLTHLLCGIRVDIPRTRLEMTWRMGEYWWGKLLNKLLHNSRTTFSKTSKTSSLVTHQHFIHSPQTFHPHFIF